MIFEDPERRSVNTPHWACPFWIDEDFTSKTMRHKLHGQQMLRILHVYTLSPLQSPHVNGKFFIRSCFEGIGIYYSDHSFMLRTQQQPSFSRIRPFGLEEMLLLKQAWLFVTRFVPLGCWPGMPPVPSYAGFLVLPMDDVCFLHKWTALPSTLICNSRLDCSSCWELTVSCAYYRGKALPLTLLPTSWTRSPILHHPNLQTVATLLSSFSSRLRIAAQNKICCHDYQHAEHLSITEQTLSYLLSWTIRAPGSPTPSTSNCCKRDHTQPFPPHMALHLQLTANANTDPLTSPLYSHGTLTSFCWTPLSQPSSHSHSRAPSMPPVSNVTRPPTSPQAVKLNSTSAADF